MANQNARTEGPPGVERDRDQPLTNKPSFLFIVSTSIGILTILLIAANAYYGIIRF